MILLDTNVLIYLYGGQLSPAKVEILRNSSLDTCNIIVAEVLGYKFSNSGDAQYFEDLLATMKNHSFNKEVTDKVIELRRNLAVKLPDAIVAATAIVNDLILWTHNTDDFIKIPQLRLFDPIA